MAEPTSRGDRFAATHKEFQLTTRPSEDLPACFNRVMPSFEEVQLQAAAFDRPTIYLGIDDAVKAKRLAMWVWSTNGGCHAIQMSLLSDDPLKSMKTAKVDCIITALIHACRDDPNSSLSLYRGVYDLDVALLEATLTGVTRTFSMRAFAATSTRKEIAQHFGEIVLRFDNVPAKKTSTYSGYPNELEYLISPETKIRFVRRQGNLFIFTSP